jgi:hypothetical protein
VNFVVSIFALSKEDFKNTSLFQASSSFTCRSCSGILAGSTSSGLFHSTVRVHYSKDLPVRSIQIYLYNNNRRNIWIKGNDRNLAAEGEKFMRKSEKIRRLVAGNLNKI